MNKINKEQLSILQESWALLARLVEEDDCEHGYSFQNNEKVEEAKKILWPETDNNSS